MIDQYIFKHNGSAIKLRELQKVTSLIFNLLKAQSNRKGMFLFRGENYEQLCQKLNHKQLDSEGLFNDKLFMVGDKGKYFQEKYIKKIKNGDISIEDTSVESLGYIFTKYNRVFKNRNIGEPITKFKDSNRDFVNYFLQNENKELFVEEIRKHNKIEQLSIRNYYLIPLHHAGEIGFYGRSFYLSTSSKSNIAQTFANSKTDASPITLVCWIPSKIMEQYKPKLPASKKGTLPAYTGLVFPKQREVSLLGGIFPHYLLGYIRDGSFEINPHLLKQTDLKQVVENGLYIDQSDFNEIIKTTNYNRFFYQKNNDGIKSSKL